MLVVSVGKLRRISPHITRCKETPLLGSLPVDLRASTNCRMVLLLGRVCGAESGMTPMRCCVRARDRPGTFLGGFDV